MSRSVGAYVLLVHLRRGQSIRVGSLGEHHFPRGTYAYVGSAMGGLEGRLRRHLSPRKKVHWHIDHLASKGDIVGAFVVPSIRKEECLLNEQISRLPGSRAVVEGFGSSDCDCQSHLHLVASETKKEIRRLYGRMQTADEIRGHPDGR
ncbi:MAG: GIY-YIG nuclease family protein [Methanomassiliicoccales archaeon]|nr:GIY-YIG nuclease family protein [Methanomassiliicoccales archaeon]